MNRSRSLLATLLLSAALVAGAKADNPPLAGKVLEVKPADMYTYLRLQTPGGETWAAVSAAPVKVGDSVTIVNPMTMRNFESKSLKRKFDSIVFGNIGTPGAASAMPAPGAAGAGSAANPHASMPKAAAGAAAPGGNPHGAAGAPGAGAPAAAVADVKVADVKVPRATGANARTVAEVVAKRAELKGKTVVIHAKVVKFTGQVMGRNWVHLRDGTGSAADGSNDLIVTTKDAATVGDVVTAEGIVKIDVDLGSGYSYPVLVEGAALRK